MNNKQLSLFVLSAALTVAAPNAFADELEELRALRDTTLSLVKLLVEQGVLSKEKAETLIRQAEKTGTAQAPAAKAAPGEGKVVRVPYVPETVKNEMREQIKQEVLAQAKSERWGEPGALPDWLSRISLDGDIRLRAQQDRFPDDNQPNAPAIIQQFNGTNINNTSENRDRLLLRARLGVQAQLADSISAGIRLATGGTGTGSSPVSTNQTLGTYGSRYSIGVDRAWLSYKPAEWFQFTGGRIANPYFAATDLVWSENVNFEGMAAKFMPAFNEDTKGFVTAGVFPIQEIEPTPTNAARTKWLYAYQAGMDWRFAGDSSMKFGVALYDYRRVEGVPNLDPTQNPITTLYDQTAPQFRQKGNSVFNLHNLSDPTGSPLYGLASKFKEVNLSASLDIAAFDPVHVIVDADFVKNQGFDRAEILRRAGVDLEPKVKGYQAKATVGMPKMEKPGDWQGFVGYRYVERDAVLDAFTDSDFHLGGTDAKGYFIGGRYTFAKNTFLGLRWLSAKEIDGLPLSIDVLQLDLNTKF